MSERSPQYRETYGAWAGFPAGHPADYARCCEPVWTNERWSRQHQCNRKRGHGPDGAYCKQHDPVAARARRGAADARSTAQWNARRYEFHGRTFFDALLKIAEGHNDARGLAQEVIAKFKDGEHRTPTLPSPKESPAA